MSNYIALHSELCPLPTNDTEEGGAGGCSVNMEDPNVFGFVQGGGVNTGVLQGN